MSWYVLHVRTAEEEKTKHVIDRDIPRAIALLPRREMRERKQGKWETVIRTLFPGYIFVNTEMTVEMYYKLSKLPGLINILGDGKPVPVPESEMQRVLSYARERDVIGISEIVIEGNKIEVLHGLLIGMEGQIISVDRRKGRAKVNFSLYGQPRIIELSVDVIKKSE